MKTPLKRFSLCCKSLCQKLFSIGLPSPRQAALFLPLFLILLFVLIFGVVYEPEQQFSYLALSFLHLKLYFLHSIGGLGNDPVNYHGHVYWSEGPLPAVLLVPFVALAQLFHTLFDQGYVSIALTLGIVAFIYKLAKRLGYDGEDSLLLAITFILGTVFIGVIAVSSAWYYAQVVNTFLLFWVLYEFTGQYKRWWLIGVINGLVLLTRPSSAFIFIFLVAEAYLLAKDSRYRWRSLAQLCVPVGLSLLIMFAYDYLRFHRIFQTGVKYELLYPASVQSRALGTFSPIHIPANLYSLLLRAPEAVLRSSSSWTLKFPFISNNSLGMSMFITSPFFIYLFTRPWKDYGRQLKLMLLSIGLIILLVANLFFIGRNQYGYRYSLDFLPILYFILMSVYRSGHKKLTLGMRILFCGSIFVNFYLLMTYLSGLQLLH